MKQTNRDRTESLIDVVIDETSSVPLKRQLYLAIRTGIAGGSIPAGSRLPTTRRLASALGLSRSTVVDAFEQLAADGLLVGTVGSGTFVTTRVAPRSRPRNTATRTSVSLSTRAKRILAERLQPSVRPVDAFRNGLPAVDLYPREQWGRYLSRAARAASSVMFDYGDPCGYAPLREAIAARLSRTRAVRCDPRQVIIVDGTQQAMDLIAQVLVDRGDLACVEDPGYPPVRAALRAAGAKLAPVPVDEEGMCVTKAAHLRPRVIVACPSHQYPLGVSLSLSRRLELLAWAQRSRAWVVEDDFENEFEYAGRPITSLQGMDESGSVIYVGTFSKTMAPSLRIGYLIVPGILLDAFAAARAVVSRGSKSLEQAALAAFITDGAFARHVHRMRDVYRERQAALVHAVRSRLGDVATIREAASGIHLLARLDPSLDDVRISQLAAKRNIDAAPVSPLALRATRLRGLVLGYAIATPARIREGVEILAQCIDRPDK